MRSLVDNAIGPRLAELLRANGHDAVHVREYGMGAAKNEADLERAGAEDRIIVSADTDFWTLLTNRGLTKPSFILFRDAELKTPEQFAAAIAKSLPLLANELETGCIAVF